MYCICSISDSPRCFCDSESIGAQPPPPPFLFDDEIAFQINSIDTHTGSVDVCQQSIISTVSDFVWYACVDFVVVQ